MAEEEQERVINHCPNCKEAIDVTEQPPFAKILCPHCDEAVRVRTVLGNFQITALLGEGGMSQVYLAEDLTLERQVALKVLHRDLSEDAALMALFEREAQLTASINHPNVVKVYKAGSEGGYFFIAMELIEKISLEELIAQSGMLNEGEVLDIAHDVASGLRAAFHGGLIHRDIKPGNILLAADGTAKLVDFGLAVQHGDEDHVEDLWATPFYVPPEKLEGEPDDFRGDIYSLGATFFHMLAGHPPFEANTASMEELKEIKAQPVTLHDHASHVSAMTGKLIDRMMAYKPDDRPQSYDELLAEIDAERDRQPGSATSQIRRQRVLASSEAAASGGPGWLPWAGIAVVIIAAATAGFAMFGGGGGNGEQALITGGEERVVTAAEREVLARFAKAREEFVNGEHASAGNTFLELLKSPDLKQPTLGWTRFNAGVAALLGGNEKEAARAQFRNMAAANGFDRTEPENRSLAEFFERCGGRLTDTLPVMPQESEGLNTESYEALALLAYGLKNWNHGQYESAIGFFDKFEAAKPKEEWAGKYRNLIGPYRSDFAAYQNLPRPRMSMGEDELAAAREALNEARKSIQTRGSLDTLIRDRHTRIAGLLEAKANLAAAPSNPNTTGNSSTQPGTSKMTAEALAEKARLAESLLSFRELAMNYRFGEVQAQLDALSFETAPVKQMHEDSKVACRSAEAFMSRLVEQLSAGSFEGVVRRKEGVPLDAKVSAASRNAIVVDLGFGPNDLEMDQLAPDWLLEFARKSWLTPQTSPPESAREPWEEAAWFAGMTGQQGEAGEFAGQILKQSTEFSERWERLKDL